MDNAKEPKKDVTEDFLLCNRCGTCRSICPVFSVYGEEGASARGKVELAEAFFRGDYVDEKRLQRIFDLCLHCMACEENCPSGMRADEIIMAVRAEMARRGRIPRLKRMILRALEGMDNSLFKLMRTFGLVRRAPLHGIGGKSPLRIFFPLLGWPVERFIPLPKEKPFLGPGRELFPAGDLDVVFPDPDAVRRGECMPGVSFDARKAAELVGRVAAARERNLSRKRRAYFFIGHTVNHFFPEEAEAVIRALNMLGIDVLAPKDQVCCGAPVFYAGDIDGARRAAADALERFAGHRYDWIVTSCSSGGLMLKTEFPRIFDLTSDGFFEIAWDDEMDTLRRVPGPSRTRREYPRAADMYREYVEGKVYDINELLVEMLDLRERPRGLKSLLGSAVLETGPGAVEYAKGKEAPANGDLPVVTYHHPCHLNRGQAVGWQPEAVLEILPGYRYVGMKDADRCCGGGGTFTFFHSEASERIADIKMDAVAGVNPDVVSTSCPSCRVQLMDMLHRRFVLDAESKGDKPRSIPVRTPVELLIENLEVIFRSCSTLV